MNEFTVVLDEDVQDWLSEHFLEGDYDFVINQSLRFFMGCDSYYDA